MIANAIMKSKENGEEKNNFVKNESFKTTSYIGKIAMKCNKDNNMFQVAGIISLNDYNELPKFIIKKQIYKCTTALDAFLQYTKVKKEIYDFLYK